MAKNLSDDDAFACLVDAMLPFGDVSDPETELFLRNYLTNLRASYFKWLEEESVPRVIAITLQLEAVAKSARKLGEAIRALSPQGNDWLLDVRPSGKRYDPGNRKANADVRQRRAIGHVFGRGLAAHEASMQAWKLKIMEGGYLDNLRRASSKKNAVVRSRIENAGKQDTDRTVSALQLIHELRRTSRAMRLRRETLSLPPRPSPYALTADAAKAAFVLERLAQRAKRKFSMRWKPRRGEVPEMQVALPEEMVVRGLMRAILEAFGVGGLKKVTSIRTKADESKGRTGNNFSYLLVAFEQFVFNKDLGDIDRSVTFEHAARAAATLRDETLAVLGDPSLTDPLRKKRGRPRKPPVG